MIDQGTLFGEPERRPELSQYFTPPWIARRLAAWVPTSWRVVEPSCGGGNLIAALLENTHEPSLIIGVELDPQWAQHTTNRFDGAVPVLCADFLGPDCSNYLAMWQPIDCVVCNPPFEKNLHSAFVERALERAPVVIGIFPSSIEFGLERHNSLWSKAQVTRRARLPQRVSYGGNFAASFDTVALQIQRRRWPREPDERIAVEEEVWVQT